MLTVGPQDCNEDTESPNGKDYKHMEIEPGSPDELKEKTSDPLGPKLEDLDQDQIVIRNEKNWLNRARKLYPKSLLLTIGAQFFNEGLVLMRVLCFKDIYKMEYGVQPASLQLFNSIMMLPWMLKFVFGLIVDTRLIAERKKYIIGFGFTMSLAQLFIFLNFLSSPWGTCIEMIIYNIGAAFIDATVDSMIVQQARKDPQNGQQDLYCFSFLFFGTGAAVGALMAALATQENIPRVGFLFGSIVAVIITICGLFITKEVETNKYALAVSPEQEMYEKQQIRTHSIGMSYEPPSRKSILCFKLKLFKQAVSQPIITKFYIFLILQGLCMPQFLDFDYYFAIDILGISKATISL